ncbi:transcription factor bHLH149-like [Silene latifolia]|uniref:transcription factor bHLH149-like n=1 Tax=Silene latifolia TaxID=37657 RepID=UPI003D77CB0B
MTTSNYDEQSEVSHRRKRRKIDENTTSTSSNHRLHQSNATQIRWRTSAEHQLYTSKLVDALRHVRRRNASQPMISGSRAVREAADKALAMAAKGRTRWSRAILSRRRMNRHKKAKIRAKILPPLITPSATAAARSSAPTIEKRVCVLSGLVPGCRKLSFPNLLEEATDYIAALQMQVRTMAALAELLSGSASSSVGSVEPGGSHDSMSVVEDDNPVE